MSQSEGQRIGMIITLSDGTEIWIERREMQISIEGRSAPKEYFVLRTNMHHNDKPDGALAFIQQLRTKEGRVSSVMKESIFDASLYYEYHEAFMAMMILLPVVHRELFPDELRLGVQLRWVFLVAEKDVAPPPAE